MELAGITSSDVTECQRFILRLVFRRDSRPRFVNGNSSFRFHKRFLFSDEVHFIGYVNNKTAIFNCVCRHRYIQKTLYTMEFRNDEVTGVSSQW
ncbi:hypothetical protein TNCV_4884701 [Trichonephila clavipes]|nr:hypothetical protein TNCV_4884701 [Trichonephila clavipes]